MASFHTKTFTIHDDYMTPKSAWENIQQFIPKDKVIWEAFYGDGQSGMNLRDMGFEVIHEPIDFFEHNVGDIIVSNPPFSMGNKIMHRLKELDKPFILIMPSSKINTAYMRNNFMNCGLQVIIPKKRIQFIKTDSDGKRIENLKNSCNFDCLYYCYKINLPNDITWLE